jgi:small subunit ribosomal protein S8
MATTDPIADLLTRIRNAITAAHRTVVLPSSNSKREVARILKEQGYIADATVAPATEHPGELLTITLKYTKDRRPSPACVASPVRVSARTSAPDRSPSRSAAWAP